MGSVRCREECGDSAGYILSSLHLQIFMRRLRSGVSAFSLLSVNLGEHVVNEEYCSQGWRGYPIDHPAIHYPGGELNVTTPSRGDLRSSAPVVFRPLGRELTARNFEANASCVFNGLPSPGGVVILDPTGLDFINLYAIAGLYHLALSLHEESGCQVALDLSIGPAWGTWFAWPFQHCCRRVSSLPRDPKRPPKGIAETTSDC